MEMVAEATLQSISSELKLTDEKKENLKKAFIELQSISSSLSSFTLTWPDLNSYFTSLQSELLHKFSLLQSIQQAKNPSDLSKPESPVEPTPVTVRPELRLFFEKMDGLGLRKYINERPKERLAIRMELASAWKYAPDPAKMVLHAMEGFYSSNSGSNLINLRKACLVLLEELMSAKVEIGDEARKRARELAEEWKEKVKASNMGGKEELPTEKLAFLHLLATFGLADDGFDMDELVNYAVVVARYRQATELCRMLGFGDRVCDVIQKLIVKGKQLLAIRFIFEFELTDKFPPVPLLKACVTEAKKVAKQLRKGGKNSRQSLNDAISKETSTLRSVIKCIEDHNLESQYPKGMLVKRMEKLEKEKADRKRSAANPVPKSQQQSTQPKQRVNKRARLNGAMSISEMQNNIASSSAVPVLQKPHMQMAGLPDLQPHIASHAGAYIISGTSPAAGPYRGVSAGLFGGAALSSGNLNTASSNQYASESHIQHSYYDRPTTHGSYGLLPQYHPAYYPN